MTSERLFNSFIPPPPPKKKTYTPKQISGYAPGLRQLSRVGGVYGIRNYGDRLDESEQVCQQRSRIASFWRSERTRRLSLPSLQFPVLLSY